MTFRLPAVGAQLKPSRFWVQGLGIRVLKLRVWSLRATVIRVAVRVTSMDLRFGEFCALLLQGVKISVAV